MTATTVLTFFGLVLSSAAVAAVVSGMFGVRIARSNSLHQDQQREEDFRNATRSRFLPLARNVYDWIWYDYGQRFGRDVGYHGDNAQKPRLETVAQLLGALDEIGDEHPDEVIREQAQRIQSRIDDCFNMVRPNPDEECPSPSEESDWVDLARDLVSWVRDGPPETPR